MLLRLAWRNIWRNKRRTLITVVSIGMGLGCVLFFVSLGEGLYYQLVHDAVRMQAGHLTLEHPSYRNAPAVDLYVSDASKIRRGIDALPDVERTKILILGEGVAKSGYDAAGVAIVAVEPVVERGLSPLARGIVEGQYLEPGDRAVAVIGSVLAERLRLKVGRKFALTTNDAHGALVEEICRVKGIFKSGSDEMDASLIHIPYVFGQALFALPPDAATQIGVVLKKPGRQETVMRRVRATVPAGVAVLRWQEILPEVAGYIRIDRVSHSTFQGMLVVIILFTIFNTVLMSVLERKREFAVLLALGTDERLIRRQVLLETTLLALIGCALGLCLALPLVAYVQTVGVDLKTFYKQGVTISGFAVSTQLHSRLTPGILAGATGLIFFATLLLSLIPMRRAARVPLTDILK